MGRIEDVRAARGGPRGGAPAGPMVCKVPVDRLRANPSNVRRDLGDLRDLASTVADTGVLLPLLVRPVGGGMFEVVDGHRRMAAARIAKVKSVPAVVHNLDRRQALVAALHTGLTARVLNHDERRSGITTLIETYGMTVKEIAASYGVTPSTVYGWMRPARAQETAASPTPRRKPVSRAVVAAFVADWEPRVADGADAGEVLDALRAIIEGPDGSAEGPGKSAQVAA